MVPIAFSLKFTPIPDGFHVLLPDLRHLKSLRSNEIFKIRGEAGWEPLIEECIGICRGALDFDPFTEVHRPAAIGYDISPAKQR